jgi:hypothetical protein
VTGAELVINERVGALRRLQLRSTLGGPVTWHLEYRPSTSSS